MTGLLEVRDVGKTYPGAPPVRALAAVSLTVRAGERIAVIGPSGSGKTTLLHVAGTLERPTGGSVRIGGEEVSGLSDAVLSRVRARRLGFVFQQFYLLDHLDAAQNVALGLLYRGVRPATGEPPRSVRSTGSGLATGSATGRPSCPAANASGWPSPAPSPGGPTSFSPDEPTGNLDSAAGAEIIALLAGLADDGTAVVVVTHDHAVAAAMDRQDRHAGRPGGRGREAVTGEVTVAGHRSLRRGCSRCARASCVRRCPRSASPSGSRQVSRCSASPPRRRRTCSASLAPRPTC